MSGIYIGTISKYDDAGKLISGVNQDKAYKFTLNDVINLMKDKYNLNIEDRIVLEGVGRGFDPDYNKEIYDIRVYERPSKIRRFIIDAQCGQLIENTISDVDDGNPLII